LLGCRQNDGLPLRESHHTKQKENAMKKLLAILVLSAFAGTTFAAAADSAKPAKTKKVHHKKHEKKAKTTDSAKAAK
jgi:hypothetical protein